MPSNLDTEDRLDRLEGFFLKFVLSTLAFERNEDRAIGTLVDDLHNVIIDNLSNTPLDDFEDILKDVFLSRIKDAVVGSDPLTRALVNLRSQDEFIKEKQNVLKEELHSYLVLSSLGIEVGNIPLSRFIPMRVYLPTHDENEVEVVARAIDNFARELGFEISDDFPPKISSWFKSWIGKSKDLLTQDEVQLRLKKAERALELMSLQKHQSEIDKANAEGAAKFLEAVETIPNVAAQIGAILIIKLTQRTGESKVFTRTLSQKEMILLEEDPSILNSPENVLERLSECTRGIEGGGGNS